VTTTGTATAGAAGAGSAAAALLLLLLLLPGNRVQLTSVPRKAKTNVTSGFSSFCSS